MPKEQPSEKRLGRTFIKRLQWSRNGYEWVCPLEWNKRTVQVKNKETTLQEYACRNETKTRRPQ